MILDLKTKSSNNISSEIPQHKITDFLFDKSYLILKILKASIDRLKTFGEKNLSKGLEWATFEMQESLVVKSDVKALQRMEKMKGGNQELETIFNWLEEYSTIKQQHKENIETVIQKQFTSNSGQFFDLGKSFDFNDKESFSLNVSASNLNMKHSNFLDFSEECIISIENPTFDIFKLEEEVGKENTLSTVSCYIFISLGLYSVINYNNFENFLHGITKGYSRKSSYHTVFIYLFLFDRIYTQLM